jgi:hypothetical protein
MVQYSGQQVLGPIHESDKTCIHITFELGKPLKKLCIPIFSSPNTTFKHLECAHCILPQFEAKFVADTLLFQVYHFLDIPESQ